MWTVDDSNLDNLHCCFVPYFSYETGVLLAVNPSMVPTQAPGVWAGHFGQKSTSERTHASIVRHGVEWYSHRPMVVISLPG